MAWQHVNEQPCWYLRYHVLKISPNVQKAQQGVRCMKQVPTLKAEMNHIRYCFLEI
jgi:hypothetical protein